MLNSSNTNAADNHSSYLTEHILPSIIGRRERIHVGVDVQFTSKRLVNVENSYAVRGWISWGSILHRMLPRLWSRGSNCWPGSYGVAAYVCHTSAFQKTATWPLPASWHSRSASWHVGDTGPEMEFAHWSSRRFEIYRVKWRHKIYSHDTVAILWV